MQRNVVVIGCGALGSTIATLLVRAAVGKVRIVDRDFIANTITCNARSFSMRMT